MGLAAYSLLLVLIVFLIGLVLLWRTISRRQVKYVSCAECLYSVEFAPATHCAECGSDLTEVGVLTPSMGKTSRRPWKTVVSLALSAFPALVAGGIVGTVVAVFLPPASFTERIVQLPQPVSGAYQSVEMSLTSRRRGDVVRIGDLCLRIEHNDGTWSQPKCFRPENVTFFEVVHTEHTESVTISTYYLAPSPDDPPGRYPLFEPSDVPEEELIAWADAIGLDMDDPQIRSELQDMTRIATEGFHGPGGTRIFNLEHFDGQMTVRGSGRSEASAIPFWIMLGVAALVWLLYARGTVQRVRQERKAWCAAANEWLARTKTPAETRAV